ncbi:MAG: hypothetical protein IJO99_01000 [Ruminococcus sp.]|nr:hypothetical protein [Ruminococcus sp.]
MAKKQKVYRSRFKLWFIAWVLCWKGSHLKWLGFVEEGKAINEQYGLGAFFGISSLISLLVYDIVEMTAITFGKYRVDADGLPVRWFKPRKAVAPVSEPETISEINTTL